MAVDLKDQKVRLIWNARMDDPVEIIHDETIQPGTAYIVEAERSVEICLL